MILSLLEYEYSQSQRVGVQAKGRQFLGDFVLDNRVKKQSWRPQSILM